MEEQKQLIRWAVWYLVKVAIALWLLWTILDGIAAFYWAEYIRPLE